eukprot:m51a1_g11349 hypothetical protein (274) ;mRNA; f:5648-6703
MLRKISRTGSGMYYFVENAQCIPATVGDCFGGLISVIAQSLEVEITGLGGTLLGTIETQYAVTRVSPAQATVALGDLYSEESRDIMFYVALPSLARPQREARFLQVSLRGTDVVSGRHECHTVVVTLERGQTTAAGAVNLDLDQQRNRVIVVRAIKDAGELSARKDFGRAIDVLREAMDVVGRLMQDLQECVDCIECDAHDASPVHSQSSQKRLAVLCDSHSYQRGAGVVFYRNLCKRMSAFDSAEYCRARRASEPSKTRDTSIFDDDDPTPT